MKRTRDDLMMKDGMLRRFARVLAALVCTGACVCLTAAAAVPSQPAGDGPQFQGAALVRPADYREWIFLSSGLGMSYRPAARDASPAFDNVFVNPSAYHGFLKTGTWPDRTVLVLEVRASQSRGSINQSGHFQTSRRGLEVHVKDARLPNGGWAFFAFPDGRDTAAPLAGAEGASCFACHTAHGAVDQTFVQFYPTLAEVARARGTFKSDSEPR